jgi:glucose-6-phosphate 1-dehydrogenase
VQNLMALRFANALFEPLWNSAHIDHVQITVAETVGVEDARLLRQSRRAARHGAEPHAAAALPRRHGAAASLDADAVRDEKLKVLRSLKPIAAECAAARCAASTAPAPTAGGRAGLPRRIRATDSRTETFVALKAEIENWRWAGVPFYLRTGKRLATRVSEIVIAFRRSRTRSSTAGRPRGPNRWSSACSPTRASSSG